MKKLLFLLFFASLSVYGYSAPEVHLFSPNVEKGTAVVVKVISEAEPKIYFGNEIIKPLKINSDYAVIIPIDIADPREEDYLDVIIGDKLNVYTISLQPHKSRTRTLTFRGRNKRYYPPKQKEIEAAERRMKFERQIMEVRNVFHTDVYFDSKFIYPIKNYNRTLYYGDFRLVKRGKKRSTYYHRGLDFAASRGTPVYASNSGKVVVAKKLTSRGNTVVVDHGLGIYTEYLHLSKIKVKEGQFVKKGDVVGKVGNTGVSTGPHLHWSLLVRGVFVNPVFLTNPVMDEIFKTNVALTKQISKKTKT